MKLSPKDILEAREFTNAQGRRRFRVKSLLKWFVLDTRLWCTTLGHQKINMYWN